MINKCPFRGYVFEKFKKKTGEIQKFETSKVSDTL
jgi:hypothetical protein